MKANTFSEEVRMRSAEDRRRADERYEILRRDHEERMEKMKPQREKYPSEEAFDEAMQAWTWASAVDAPSKPGAIANNH